MKYQELVDVYSSLEATTKRLEKTDIIADYLKTLDSDTIEKVGSKGQLQKLSEQQLPQSRMQSVMRETSALHA